MPWKRKAPHCITRVFAQSETASEKTPKTMYECTVEAHESTRQRAESSQLKNHEDHIASKGFTSMTHYNFVHKFIPRPQAMKILDAGCRRPAWHLEKVKSKKEVILKAQRDKKKVHFATRMAICHLKKCGVGTKVIVLGGDMVEDDSGAYAGFTEQGSSASQITAAKVMDVIARLPGCDGQAADAVSAYTQVKFEDAPRLLKIPNAECPDVWMRLPRHKWPKSCEKH